jgi:hypothetical protein
MSFAYRWLSVGLLSLCVTFANAASKGTEETVNLGQHALSGDSSRITTLRLHLHDGDYRIVGVDSDDITVRTDGKNRPLAKKMKVRFDRQGNVLDVTLLHVPKNEFQVTIEVPRQTGLFARMRVGDLSVVGVAGDKDLELTGGDLSIQVPDPDDYGTVDLSVKFGDVSGSQFGNPTGWMGNSVRRDGSGKYKLHAHVFAGDLMLQP